MPLADTLNQDPGAQKGYSLIEFNTEYWHATIIAQAITASRFSNSAFFLKGAHEERRSFRAVYAAYAA